MRRPVGVKWVHLLFRWTRFFSRRVATTVATLPSALFVERFGSLGASWVFSFQPVLPPDCRPPVPSFRNGLSSALSKACQYALTLWRKLTRFLEYPELELSNNLAENSMRPVALGRKNWIHIGSLQAGPKVAAIFSVVESCRRLKLPVRDHLAGVLPGLADLPIQRLPDLIPTAWVPQHS